METTQHSTPHPAMGAGSELHIASQASLEPLSREIAHNLHRRFRTLRVEAVGLDEVEGKHWQERLEKHYFACGCGEATAFGFVFAGTFIIFRVMSWGAAPALHWTDAAAIAGAFLLGAAVGKWLGRLLARRRLIRAINELRARLPTDAESQAPQGRGMCGVSG